MRIGFTCLTGIVAAAASALAGGFSVQSLDATAVLAGGSVHVDGAHAMKSSPVSWEGTVMTSASKAGRFAFTTTIVPLDCIGTVSDGVRSIEVPVAGCPAMTPGLPGTGQTTTYAAGDDGDLGIGGPLSYVDNGNGTVTDRRTGLTWEKKTSTNVDHFYGWQEALDYVASLNAMNGGAGFAGHNDWRLPNVKELLSIVDYGRFNPSIDPIFGPTAGNFTRVRYWSSTSWAAYYPESNAWAVDFSDAYAHYTGLAPFGKTSAIKVRAVRGGF